MSELPYLSIVVPAYNEAGRLPPTLLKLGEFFRDFTHSYEVLIVVEKSSDGTLEIASGIASQQAHFQVIDNRVQKGKGYAVRSGINLARGEFVFYMDADLSVPLAEVSAFLRHWEEYPRIDVLIGNRRHALSRITRRQAWLRRTMGQAFNKILHGCGLAPLHDTQCGFKAFRRVACREIFSRQTLNGFAFDVEVLLLAERLGCQIADLPVEWINSTESKVRIVRDSLGMLIDTLTIRRSVDARLNAERLAPHPGAPVS
jgi:dolichyl-phosphate beta-glucosyltransferase